MRGYGDFRTRTRERWTGPWRSLNAELARIASYLAQGATADLQARLLRLEQTRDEVKLLRELDRIIAAHGLVEFRDALVTLLDRLETTLLKSVFLAVSVPASRRC